MSALQCPACSTPLTPRDHLSLRRKVPFELEPDERGELVWRYETVAVLAWKCSHCASTVWQFDGPLVAEPPVVPEPVVARSPEPAPRREPRIYGTLLVVNGILVLVCFVMAFHACDTNVPLGLVWFVAALGLFAVNYAIDRRRRSFVVKSNARTDPPT